MCFYWFKLQYSISMEEKKINIIKKKKKIYEYTAFVLKAVLTKSISFHE